MPAEATQPQLVTWFWTGWRTAVLDVWPDVNDGRLISIRNLTGLDPLDHGSVNSANVLSKLHTLPLETLRTEKNRREAVVAQASEIYSPAGEPGSALQTVTSPNLPDPNPLGSLFSGLFDSLKGILLPAAIVVGGLWYLSTRKDRHE